MFRADEKTTWAKFQRIWDDATDIVLDLDTDDVNPEDVTEENVQRLVDALNREFYPPRLVDAGTEYGVRTVGGHVYPAISRHVAANEVERHLRLSEGGLMDPKPGNTYVVRREVTLWEKV